MDLQVCAGLYIKLNFQLTFDTHGKTSSLETGNVLSHYKSSCILYGV